MANLTKPKLAGLLYDSYCKHVRLLTHKQGLQPWNAIDATTRNIWLNVAGDALKKIEPAIRDEVEDALHVERSRKR